MMPDPRQALRFFSAMSALWRRFTALVGLAVMAWRLFLRDLERLA